MERSKAEYTAPRILTLDSEEIIKILGPASGYGTGGGNEFVEVFGSGGSGGTRAISQK